MTEPPTEPPTEPAAPPVAQQVAVLRIIVPAMATGVLVFAAILHFVIGPAEEGAGANLLTNIALGAGLLALVAQQVVGAVVRVASAKKLPVDASRAEQKLVAGFMTSTILAGAILEAAAMANLVVYGFLAGRPVLLGMAGLLVLAILTKFPLPGVVEGWIERQLRAAREERDLRGGA